ncbi:MAG: GNAT family N-acetyltransferase [Promethearchaeota archaeon]
MGDNGSIIDLIEKHNLYIPKREDLKECAAILGEAFWDYPGFTISFKEDMGNLKDKYKNMESIPIRRKRKLSQLFEIILKYTQGYGRIVCTSPEIEGVIIFYEPPKHKYNLFRMLISGALKIPFMLGLYFTRMQNKISDFQEKIRGRIKEQEHIYFSMIGVKPEYQGKKFGKRLINFLKEYSRSKGLPIYLETNKNQNVEIYKKLGFKLIGHERLDLNIKRSRTREEYDEKESGSDIGAFLDVYSLIYKT